MTAVIAGMDMGGTKTAVFVENLDGERLVELELASEDWDASPPAAAAAWIAERLRIAVPDLSDVVALGVGAQGCDTAEHCRELAHELGELGLRSTVVNDAALLVEAAGFHEGIGVISGTGAIAVGQDASGDYLITGGWGWVLGDEAGAPGLVREATKAVLSAYDRGLPDDGLLSALQAAFAVDAPAALARAVNDEPTMDNWGSRAPALFAAADAGSPLALSIIESGARHLVDLVGQLLARGSVGLDVVAGGSVIVNQPRLYGDFVRLLAAGHPRHRPHLLEQPPVVGALALARRLV